MLQQLLDWLAGLPPAALYLSLALAAGIENVFPPFPADTVVAFGSFLAARGEGSAIGSFLATWIGNVAGAMGMYAAGRRFGAERLTSRLGGGAQAAERVRRLYGKYGLWALCLTRFLPGVRAIVPPFAGALRIPPARVAAAMALASGIWYGVITVLAFRVGSSWDVLVATIAQWGRWAAIVVAVIALIGGGAWLLRRRRS